MEQKRVAVIHDLSCFGKCSLTVALPVLSAAGVETAVIPTAVLSTHTGGFGAPYRQDLSEAILPIAEHWQREGVTADMVYTGYLCSQKQIETVLKATHLISREDTRIVTDPCFADHGKLYRGFRKDYPKKMLTLCRAADIITPNLTEAVLLTGDDYKPSYSKEEITSLLQKLYDLTGAQIVLTGVSFEEGKIGAAVFEGEKAEFLFADRVHQMFHGTGDLFTATLIASLLNGKSLTAAAQVAVSFTRDCIKQTVDLQTEERFGVDFESQIPKLMRYLEL